MKTLIFSLLIAVAYGQGQHSCIHNNHQQHQAELVVERVASDVDADKNGTLDPSEVSAFLALFDHDTSGHVLEHEFVQEWHHRYHDVHEFAVYIFYHFDRDVDHELTLRDMFSLYNEINTDGQPEVSMDEFKAWLLNLYKTCVTTGHHG